VAELVPDGATLPLGIGAIPTAVCAALGGKRDLGVHTEMFSDGVVDLVERGIVTGARKERHPLLPQDGRGQLGDRGGPDRPGQAVVERGASAIAVSSNDG